MTKKNMIEELFEGYDSSKQSGGIEFDWGEDVGRERIFSMTDEEYEKEYGEIK